MRAAAAQQVPVCIWFTGLSGSGKSTLANALELELFRRGRRTMLLDGDNVRHGLCRDLGMDDDARHENIRRVAEVAKLMTDAGLIVISAFISPFVRDRQIARELFIAGRFIEVYVETPLEVCVQRDPKQLYAKALRGEIKNFTGIDSSYEPPLAPEMRIDTSRMGLEEAVANLCAALERVGSLGESLAV
ncbi:adenylyl-sulfate kinase [Pseudomonas sp. UL073]|uniref:Adenylyl-sulfate kinase n=2 Tax=Zestomonas insulae TaxID=2809017 RepID=A0ABS2IDZ1_9GAMM|nr:adenylyl-sulfate kinase [Pseudomonas insulae]